MLESSSCDKPFLIFTVDRVVQAETKMREGGCVAPYNEKRQPRSGVVRFCFVVRAVGQCPVSQTRNGEIESDSAS
jgi:hypothetical protein